MTQQQAEQLAVRLSAVWDFDKYDLWQERGAWSLQASLSLFVSLSIDGMGDDISFKIANTHSSGYARFYSDGGVLMTPELDKWPPELNGWENDFRRNCYLSGCPVECTAHEKIEWTKWFEERQLELTGGLT